MDLSSVTWRCRSFCAMDVARSLRRPALAKVDWSHYGQATQPHNAGAEDVFVLHSRQCSSRVTASNVLRDGGQRYVEAGSGLAVPVGYQGWFKILHHPDYSNSFAARPEKKAYTSAREIYSTGVKTFLAAGSDVMAFRVEDSKYEPHSLPPGTLLCVEGECTERVAASAYRCCCHRLFKKRQSPSDIKYLRCLTIGQNEEVLIPMDAEGTFWPIGESDNLQPGYVYQISQLLDYVKETHGYVVELVHGKPPPKHEQFSGILRLNDVVKQEVIVACPLQEKMPRRKPVLLEFPVHSFVSFYLATNGTNLQVVKDTIEIVARNLAQYMNCMKVVTTMVLRSSHTGGSKSLTPCPQQPRCRQASEEYDDDSLGTETSTDYDTIPCDDPIYENDPGDFLQQTARRLREELAKRALNVASDDREYVPPARETKCTDQRLDSFLVSTVDEMARTKATSRAAGGDAEIANQQDVENMLDDMFDCDVMSTSTHSGAILVSREQQKTSDASDDSEGTDNQQSSISSLYKKVKPARQADSGISKCSTCAAGGGGGGGGGIWQPPDDLSALSVEEVGRALSYIGLRTELVDLFRKEQIDGHQLNSISKELLKEAFPQMNGLDIKKLMDFQDGWRPKRDK